MSPEAVDLLPAAFPAERAAVEALFREYEQALGIDLCFQNFADELATLPGRYAAPAGTLLLARAGDALLGCVALRPLGDGIAELKRLYVRPAGRGLGLGRRLSEAALAHARAAGHRAVRLDTLATMDAARALYAHLGFVPIRAYCHNPLPGVQYLELRLD